MTVNEINKCIRREQRGIERNRIKMEDLAVENRCSEKAIAFWMKELDKLTKNK